MNPTHRDRPWKVLVAGACVFLGAARVGAQAAPTAAFVMTEGKDTISLERYTRVGNRITGVWVSHSHGSQVHDYVLTLGPDGKPARYEMTISTPGAPMRPGSFRSVTVTYAADSATFVTKFDTTVTRRVASQGSYPLLGRSLVTWELAFNGLRTAHADSGTIRIHAPTSTEPVSRAVPVRVFGADSAIVAGAAVARFDRSGRLVAWTAGPTEAHRVSSLDVAKIVAGFVTADAPRLAAEAAAEAARTEITLADSVLDRLVGDYRLTPDVAAHVTRDGHKLMILLDGQPSLQLFPESPAKFFLKTVPAQVEFDIDASGASTGLTLVQNGRRLMAPKSQAFHPDLTGVWVMDTTKFVKDDSVLKSLTLTLSTHGDTLLVLNDVVDVTDQKTQATRSGTVTLRYMFDGTPLPVTMGGGRVQLVSRVTWEGATMVITATGTLGDRTITTVERWSVDTSGRTLTRTHVDIVSGRERSQTLLFTRRRPGGER